ncbi:MAG TPA: hypothetical protein VES89_09125, partial [Candidatus Competibacteraceae bacterium]|nr:hypothetical protein [Candidatus Competibacteraceae bacterium]
PACRWPEFNRHQILSSADVLSVSQPYNPVFSGWNEPRKLQYLDRVMRAIGHCPPQVTADDFDSAGELACSLTDHYQRFCPQPDPLPAYFDGDLATIFDPTDPTGGHGGLPAHDFLQTHQRDLMATLGHWTGLNDRHVRALIAHFIQRTEVLRLWANPAHSAELLLKLGVYATALCMNKLYQGDFIIR